MKHGTMSLRDRDAEGLVQLGLVHGADEAGAQPHGSGLIAQGHGSHADVHLGEVLGTVVLRDAGLDVCLILTDQDEVGHPVSPGAASEPVVVQRFNELGPGLWLVDDDEAPGLGVAAAGGQPGYVHQVGQGLPGHGAVAVHTAALPGRLQSLKIHFKDPLSVLLDTV